MSATVRCIRPREIRPGDLVAYTRGEAGASVQQHVDRCEFCRDEAHSLATTESNLRSRLFRRFCPPTLTLAEYAGGFLAPAERQQTAAHLVECPLCLAESRDAARFLAEAEREEKARGLSFRAALGRLFAQPLPRPAGLGGLRGSAGDESTMYSADETYFTISVQRATRGRGFVVAGLLQETPGESTGLTVALYQDNQLIQAEAVDDLGSFTFENISAGTYRLEIARPAGVVVIEGITAG